MHQQISEKVNTIQKKIEELIKAEFTGSINLKYDFLAGKLMGVSFITKEQMTKNAELININDFPI